MIGRGTSAIGRNVITSPHHGPSGMRDAGRPACIPRAVRHARQNLSFFAAATRWQRFIASESPRKTKRPFGSERAHDQGKPLGPSGMQADAYRKRRSGGPSGMQTGTRRRNVAPPRAIRSLATLRYPHRRSVPASSHKMKICSSEANKSSSHRA